MIMDGFNMTESGEEYGRSLDFTVEDLSILL
jgi:hypothetical protein